MDRKETLHQAELCVCGAREQDYGTPEQNFELIAQLWESYLSKKCVSDLNTVGILAEDVAAMMCLFKIARIAAGGRKEDNWVDLAGYAACGSEIESKRNGEWKLAAEEKAVQCCCMQTRRSRSLNTAGAERQRSGGMNRNFKACRACGDRYPGCHGECSKYAEEKKAWEETRKKMLRDETAAMESIDRYNRHSKPWKTNRDRRR